MVTTRKKRKKRIEISGRSELRRFSVFLWLGVLFVVGFLMPKTAAEDVPAAAFNTLNAQIEGTPPQLTTFFNTSGSILWPGRFRFTEFTTEETSTGEKCHFQIFGANSVLGGRRALTDIEVHLLVTRNNTVVDEGGIRIEGVAKNGNFIYTERRRPEFIVEPPVDNKNSSSSDDLESSGSGDGSDDIDDGEDDMDDGEDDMDDDVYDWGPPMAIETGNGERVAFTTDEDKFATLDVPQCSTVIMFRAPNVDQSQQNQSPGLFVTINNNGPVVFKSPETYLAETNVEGNLRIGASNKNIQLKLEILHQTMEYAARQYSTAAGRECEDTAQIYRSHCQSVSKKTNALKTCYYFLEKPDLVSCMDPPGDTPTGHGTNAFKLCLWNSCSPSKSVCRLLRERVEERGCTSALPPELSQITCPP